MDYSKFLDFHNNGIHEISPFKERIPELIIFSEKVNFRNYLFDSPICSKSELLNQFYTKCKFPNWFGFNWDALLDSLSDETLGTSNGYIFIMLHSSETKGNLGDDFDMFKDVFLEASNRWRARQVSFNLLLA